MKLVVFGASGATGEELVAQALAKDHAVTAFARRPHAPGTRDAAAVAEAVRGQDAVISTLGVRNTFFPSALMQRSVANIVAAMDAAGVKRFVLMSAYGVGASRDDAPLLPRLIYCTFLRAIFADKEVAEERLRASALDWTIVYPVLLTNGPRTGHYRAGERLELHGLPTISRADVADFMLGEIASPRYLR